MSTHATSSETPDQIIARLQSQGTQLVAQYQSLQQENTQLKAAADALALQGQQLQSSNLKPKIPLPRVYQGDTTYGNSKIDTMKVAPTVDEWIDEMERQFSYYGTSSFPDSGSQRVSFASMYLQGQASQWWQQFIKARVAASQPAITAWVDFVSNLRSRYRPLEASRMARVNLDHAKQTGTVQAYTDYFLRQLNYITDMSVQDQLHIYVRGLDSDIMGEVMNKNPQTVAEAVQIAHLHESLLRSTKGRGNKNYRSVYRGASSSSPNPSGSTPMELGNVNMEALDDESMSSNELIQRIAALESTTKQQQQIIAALKTSSSNSGKNKVPGVSREEFDRCRKEGLCLKCKQKGHIAANCTSSSSRLKQ
jgi:hypothetical protein